MHAKGGKIFIQLWHVGRISHTELQPGKGAPVAPSAIRANTKTFVGGQFVETSEPRALELNEIPGIIDDFRKAAANAIKAGFDGVEIHGANGYLLEQFARDSLNTRSDAYGGSIENRARLMIEVAKAVTEEIGADRTGIRISPVSPANDLGQDSDPAALYGYIVDELSKLKLVYLHVVEGATGGPRDVAPFDFPALRKRFSGAYIANNGYDLTLAECNTGRWPRGSHRLRSTFHRQPGSGRAPQGQCAAQRTRQANHVWRRRQGLHRLSDAGAIARSGGVRREHRYSCERPGLLPAFFIDSHDVVPDVPLVRTLGRRGRP